MNQHLRYRGKYYWCTARGHMYALFTVHRTLAHFTGFGMCCEVPYEFCSRPSTSGSQMLCDMLEQ